MVNLNSNGKDERTEICALKDIFDIDKGVATDLNAEVMNTKVSMPVIDFEATKERVSDLIKASGLTDKQLSEIEGVSVNAANKWRRGVGIPKMDNFLTLSKLFGVSLDDLIVSTEYTENISNDTIRSMSESRAKIEEFMRKSA